MNIDAASQTDSRIGTEGVSAQELQEHVARTVKGIVSQRGKMHNPVTGSGGMLLGTIKEFGPLASRETELKKATL